MSGENTDPRVGPGIGRSLERARKSRGLSLWQVEQATRIRSRYLHDLERENFDVLPAVYVLGSLKTYADFLGLDGAALSRQLKASLVEPAEADAPDQPAALGDARDEDDEYEAAPVPAVGFDQLFLGMGVILVSILAVMTIVTAVAQGDESPISQLDQPSTPEAPSEIALAGNVREEDGVNEAGSDGPANDESTEAQPQPEAPKDEGGEEDKNESEKDDGEASQSASLFGDAEFVPMSPASPTADASASASPSAASSAASSPSSASSPAPTTAEPDDARASAAPEPTPPASTAPSPNEATPSSSEGSPGAASPAPSGGGASPPAGGGGGGAPAGESGPDPMSTEAGRMADAALKKVGIVR